MITALKKFVVPIGIGAVLLAGCTGSGDKKLPILGERDWVEKVIDGKTVTDTIYHQIPGFSFVSQHGDSITEKQVEGKIFVADFFFTSCPTICPVMKKNMLKVFKAIQDKPDVAILSHTIDPVHDTPQVLLKYATDLGVSGDQWLFLTGQKADIYGIAQRYFVAANEEGSAPGGFIHSGAFTLVDKDKHVRGVYDGTDDKKVAQLISDIEVLRKEYEKK
ncbi:SCO family protein [Ravibacter arvi]|uniref:SCO family protein n=1 Tax=Ravibacter arvi TaxID=2051041 RepID=A0ABP8LV54_9BACT